MSHEKGGYYIPDASIWPIIGSIALGLTAFGVVHAIHGDNYGFYFLAAGASLLIFMMFGWFSAVIHENRTGLHNKQMDRSYRWGMTWFIFSEVMFFAVFFGALFFCRVFALHWLGGTGTQEYLTTHTVLWPNFIPTWPLLVNPDQQLFHGAHEAMQAWGIPALNTAILLTSGVTITWAHWSLKKNKRGQLAFAMLITILLGMTFLAFQAHEYQEAYHKLGLTLGCGIYGTTFYMLTGFHGLHVTIGTIMLIVILMRCLKGHFTPENHFGFEGVAWYWHFVDVVWLLLFIFVYWI